MFSQAITSPPTLSQSTNNKHTSRPSLLEKYSISKCQLPSYTYEVNFTLHLLHGQIITLRFTVKSLHYAKTEKKVSTALRKCKMLSYQVILLSSVGLFTVAQAQVSANYFGSQIGAFSTLAHGVNGTMYAIDNTTLWIRGFNYDGAGPDAFFWAGSTTSPSTSGEIIPDENGSLDKLGGYTNANLTINLPTGRVITDYKWISVWCRQFAANFGQVLIASNFVAPSPVPLGVLGFTPRVHNVRADDVILLDSQTVKFINLVYDGYGPAAYFWVGTGSGPSTAGYRVPDQNGSKNTILRRFTGEDITIKFHGELTVFDIDYIGLWCELARQDFGHVDIPTMPNVIPSVIDEPPPTRTRAPTPTPLPPFDNCEPLSDTFQVLWQIRDQYIDIELRGLIPMNTYMSFGLSGATDRTSMVGSDVVVAWLDGPEAKAVDYDLNAYAQCSGGSGACPDTESSNLGVDSVTDIEGYFADGVTYIKYTRLLNTGDSTDKIIPSSGDVYISWAIGLINADGLAVKHSIRTPTSKTINFGRSAENSCPALVSGVEPTAPEPWPPLKIPSTIRQFDLKIGPSGGDRGYTAITGRPGWGIAWYVNELMIPELTVQRGISYTFRVFGGSDPARSADYHPFYITNDDAGGLASLAGDEIRNDTVTYAGPVNGSLCSYKNTGEDQSTTSDTFADYFMTLTVECQSPMEPAELVWTPDENTPDLVYYQCYTHRYLGWRINVVDDGSPLAEPVLIVVIVLLVVLFLFCLAGFLVVWLRKRMSMSGRSPLPNQRPTNGETTQMQAKHNYIDTLTIHNDYSELREGGGACMTIENALYGHTTT